MNWHNVPVLRIVIREMPKRALLFFGESEDRRSYRWEPARKVAPILTEDRRGQTRFVQLHAVAVEFQLKQPAFAHRRRCSQPGRSWRHKGNA